MKKTACLLLVLFVLLVLFPNPLVAQDQFFKGKTVRVIVPFAAGDGSCPAGQSNQMEELR